MPYKFRQSQMLAPARKLIPELVQSRDLLRDHLADMSTTGRGVSQTECYRTLVQVEALVNDGHHCTPQDCAQMAQRLGRILEGSGSKLSLADIKAIRRVTRPFARGNPLVQRDSSRTMRSHRRRMAADEGAPEESAFEALPPIASAVPAEAGAGGADGAPNSDRATRQNSRASYVVPARKPRQRSEWDAVILKRDEDDMKVVEAEKQLVQEKKERFRREVNAQQEELVEKREAAAHSRLVDQEQVAAKVQQFQEAEAMEKQRRAEKAAQLRKWNEEGLVQRQKILEKQQLEAKQIEEKLVAKSRADEEQEQAKQESKRARQAQEDAQVRRFIEQNKVMRAEEREKEHVEQKRVATEAQRAVERREQEREHYIESQRQRIARMMDLGGEAVAKTEQRVKDDNERAERWAAEQERASVLRDEQKAAKRAALNREMQEQLDAQMVAMKAERAAQRRADRQYMQQQADEMRKAQEADEAKEAARKATEVATQSAVLGQIREKYGDAVQEEPPTPGGSKPKKKLQRDMNMHERRANRELLQRATSLEEEKYKNDTFARPPPGMRPRRN